MMHEHEEMECQHEETERGGCSTCAGSGEGMHDGTFCGSCNGSGEGQYLYCEECGECIEEEGEWDGY